ncbi:MAG TPA: DUF1990 domain-containing protein [Acidisarcina sp.]
MFRLTRAGQRDRDKLFAAAQVAPVASPHLLTLADGPLGPPPKGFVHDYSKTQIGVGPDAFMIARRAFQRWEEFDLGWVNVTNQAPSIVPGEFVAVEVFAAFLWSTNVSRVVEIVDASNRFGFLYATTALHVEEGQERFVLELDPRSGAVFYLIEAISRPRHILARIGYPFSRVMQRRFARDSHARMRRSVQNARKHTGG